MRPLLIGQRCPNALAKFVRQTSRPSLQAGLPFAPDVPHVLTYPTYLPHPSLHSP